MLAGVVLAGGQSSRMGQDKSLLALPNSALTLLNNCQLLLSHLEQVEVWVSGVQHQNGIRDIYPNCGPLSGIHAVLNYLHKARPDINEMLFVPVDMPALTVDELECLIIEGREKSVICSFEHHQFPIYIPKNEELLSYLDGHLSTNYRANSTIKNKQLSMRHILTLFSANQIPVKNFSTLININTPQQWQAHYESLTIKGK
ncbi:molybdenum cofactor guanylyltransferase [Paraglaciecola aquimarina]|uniref:Molybdenum cofactor guanylyltransferase n=1 Tax=Paraglaciecola aquimarina TaxID=1235557 RepID=A0ABU3SYQ6_9ALTE|nr:molybdenum cofactor guanylyltransferase [Paraglaciecola aquimarina]MDU0355153.1 molybdenum cofactor guanylyltransferase [Paraglaciecola aquimarina]